MPDNKDEEKAALIENEEADSLLGLGGLDVPFEPSRLVDKDKDKEKIVEDINKGEDKENVLQDAEVEDKELKDKEAGEKELKDNEPPATSPDWDTDDNPFKKRYTDTKNWGTKANQDKLLLEKQNAALEANIADIRNELDLGAFVPSITESPKEEFVKRLAVSESAVYLAYGQGDIIKGEVLVDKLIGPGSGFLELAQGNPEIKQRFLNSISPAAEAILIMHEQKKLPAINSKTPEEIKAALRKEIEDEVRVKATIKDTLKAAPKGLPRKQGNTRGKETQSGQEDAMSLSSISGLGN